MSPIVLLNCQAAFCTCIEAKPFKERLRTGMTVAKAAILWSMRRVGRPNFTLAAQGEAKLGRRQGGMRTRAAHCL
eukprot:3201009-Pleurochrysis_carterae.AAC.5